jgi:dihydrodipicolinate synthase/N-acetylneuraminate lyase
MAISDIRGVYPPLLTPFTEAGDVDYNAHKRNIDKWNKIELGGYLVLGSNSETAYLKETEKLKLIELTLQYASRGRTIFAGTGLESTRETIRLTNKAAEIGAHAALLLTPFFYGTRMTDDALVYHYRTIAESSRIPILIYNMPACTHLNISVEAVGVLSGHPNIIGMKDSSGDVPRLAATLKAVPPAFNLIVGTASAWHPALELGVRAGILALSNFAGAECALIQKYHDSGESGKAKLLSEQLQALNRAVTTEHGVAGLKYAATLAGYEGGWVRRPLAPLNEADRKKIEGLIVEAGLLPAEVAPRTQNAV